MRGAVVALVFGAIGLALVYAYRRGTIDPLLGLTHSAKDAYVTTGQTITPSSVSAAHPYGYAGLPATGTVVQGPPNSAPTPQPGSHAYGEMYGGEPIGIAPNGPTLPSAPVETFGQAAVDALLIRGEALNRFYLEGKPPTVPTSSSVGQRGWGIGPDAGGGTRIWRAPWLN